jgi:septal ring factor EnvC (AmiA/AmiB activator)
MEEIHPRVQIILNTLIEEKHRVRSEIDHLNKVFEARDTQISSLVQLLTDLKTEAKISNDQIKVETLLNENRDTRINIEIKSPSNRMNNNAKLNDCKIALKKHRKGVAKLAQSIKDELDVFQVCFLADLEAIQAKLAKPVTKVVLFSEIIHEAIEDEAIEEVVKNEQAFNDEIEIVRIKFDGIKKKPIKGKKK